MRSGVSTASKPRTSAPRPKPQRWITNRQKRIPNNWSRQLTPPAIAQRYLTNRNFTESSTSKDKNMKTHLVLMSALLYATLASAAENAAAATLDRISVFN